MPCNIKHGYHEECITGWLKTHINCPTCRAEVTQEAIDACYLDYKNKFVAGGRGLSQALALTDGQDVQEDKDGTF